jgi:hypothetical protein
LVTIAASTPTVYAQSREEIKLTTIIPDQHTLRVRKGIVSTGRYRQADFPDSSIPSQSLIIDEGNVGIGIIAPIARLDISSAARTGTHPAAVKGMYVTGNFGAASDGVEFRHTNATQGIGFGYNSIYAAGTSANQNLNLMPKGTGKVGIGTTSPEAKLHIGGTPGPTNGIKFPDGTVQTTAGGAAIKTDGYGAPIKVTTNTAIANGSTWTGPTKVTTDGFLILTLQHKKTDSGSMRLKLYVGSTSSPGILVAWPSVAWHVPSEHENASMSSGFCIPIPKNWYYRIVAERTDEAGTNPRVDATLYFIEMS